MQADFGVLGRRIKMQISSEALQRLKPWWLSSSQDGEGPGKGEVVVDDVASTPKQMDGQRQ